MSNKARKYTVEQQIALGQEGYPSVRDQYIYSLAVTSLVAMAKIWGIKPPSLRARVSKSKGTDNDWPAAREAHKEAVAKAVTATVKLDAARETEGTISTFAAINGMLMRHIMVGSAEEKLTYKATVGYARALKLVVDMHDTLSGHGKIKKVREARRAENKWFRDWALENVTDPEKLKSLARLMRDRLIAHGHTATNEYGDMIAMAKGDEETMSRAQAEMQRVSEGRRPAKDVTPKATRRPVRRPKAGS